MKHTHYNTSSKKKRDDDKTPLLLGFCYYYHLFLSLIPYSCFSYSCDDRSGQVKSLNLSGTFLSSSLKTNSSLFKLQYLRHLDLGGCNLQGEIPSSLGNLSRLTFLDLSYNKLVGEIPSSLGNLSRLLDLDLSWNKLVGEVPASMGNLKELNVMRLDENILSGKFPISLANLTKLSTFCARDNSFHGPFPKSLFLIPSLEWCFLDGNQFTGPIEFENASSSSKLYYLYLGRNRLDGPIPASISQFLNLEKLHLSYNNFSGTLPDIFANATKLQLLDVSHNQLEGNFPKSLINCKALRFVNVGSNKIKDTFPSRLGSLPSLQVLILRSNEFYGPLYHDNVSIGFQSLRIIDISHNGFTGTLPPHYFSSWREMTTLTTAIFEYMIGRVSNTSYVIYDYESMEMVNKGVDMSFERIRQDFTAIDFSGNRIHGKIPESVGFLKKLRLLNLSGNALTNDIPWILTNLTKLEALDLSRNNLSGQIPQGLGKLSFLSYMNFSHNRLQGPVPQGTQFQRQKCSSFSSNPRLYGLEDICGETHVPNPTSHQPEELPESDEQMFNWVAAAIAYGPGVFCGLVIGYIFNSQNHERFTEKFGRRKL